MDIPNQLAARQTDAVNPVAIHFPKHDPANLLRLLRRVNGAARNRCRITTSAELSAFSCAAMQRSN
ncbi:hypothetical protein [Sphingomonas bacterium]|uniref:hypothetical protein n=1 Tax=Sphingomonas bacterium TaxID=1895847 RepID=UPI001575B2D4|nr:hypothetical protein [Sphingomonas bacterium]